MGMYFFVAIICLAQLCGAQNSTDSLNEIPEDSENPEITEIPVESTSYERKRPFQWETVKWPTSNLPSDVVLGGVDSPHLCSKTYVGRAWYNGNLLPAKVCGSDGRAFVSYNGTEVMLNESEVLCTKHALWKPIKESRIPKGAFPVGNTTTGERLFVGRWFVGLRLIPGKVEANSKMLQMTYAEQIYSSYEYEILILMKYDDYF